MSNEQNQTPPWVAPVVACVRDNPNWLLDAMQQIADAVTPDTRRRTLGLRAIVADIPVPHVASDAAFYGQRVLELLTGPKALLATPEELAAVVDNVVVLARARCGVLAAALTALAADESEVAL